jgi:hypothetical protein
MEGDQPVTRPLPTQDNTNVEKTHTSMPQVGSKPTIPVFEEAMIFPCNACVQFTLSVNRFTD